MLFKRFIRVFSEINFATAMDELSTGLHKLTFDENINCQVKVIGSIPANTEIKVSHSLKVVPKYKIILRKSGNAIISDGAERWTETYITLKNESGNEITNLTVAIVVK